MGVLFVMSSSNRKSRFSAVTALFFSVQFSLIGAMAFSLGVAHTERQLRAEQNTKEYPEGTNESIASACTGREASELVECVREKVESTEDHRRSEYDLSAQQDMADYAFWLVWISVATIAVTSMGVWFVKRTLDATLIAVEDTSIATEAMRQANLLMQREQRPWIQFEVVEFGLRHATDQEGLVYPYFLPIVKFKNWGRIPAFGVTLSMKVIHSDGISIDAVKEFLDERVKNNAITFPIAVFPNTEITVDKIGSGMDNFTGLSPDKNNLPSNKSYIIAIATYGNEEISYVTSKIFMLDTSILIDIPVTPIMPDHLMPFDRYY